MSIYVTEILPIIQIHSMRPCTSTSLYIYIYIYIYNIVQKHCIMIEAKWLNARHSPILIVAVATCCTNLKACLHDMTNKKWNGVSLECVGHWIKFALSNPNVNINAWSFVASMYGYIFMVIITFQNGTLMSNCVTYVTAHNFTLDRSITTLYRTKSPNITQGWEL